MIEILNIQNDCEYIPGNYRICALLPKEFEQHVVALCLECKPYIFTAVGNLAGYSTEVFDFEIQGDEFVWASTLVGDVSCAFTADQRGIHVSMSFEKQAEGDDRLDDHAFRVENRGKLPDNFWIEPAALLRAFTSACISKH
jgi:hypothetical protein